MCFRLVGWLCPKRSSHTFFSPGRNEPSSTSPNSSMEYFKGRPLENNLNLSILCRNDNFLPDASKSVPSPEMGFPHIVNVPESSTLPTPTQPGHREHCESSSSCADNGTNHTFHWFPEQSSQELTKTPETEVDQEVYGNETPTLVLCIHKEIATSANKIHLISETTISWWLEYFRVLFLHSEKEKQGEPSARPDITTLSVREAASHRR